MAKRRSSAVGLATPTAGKASRRGNGGATRLLKSSKQGRETTMQRTTLSNPSSQVAEKKAPLRRSRPTPKTTEDMRRIPPASTKQSGGAAFAYIEFDSDGHVLSANDLFLDCMGYELEEIAGKHHRQFVEAGYASSNDYAKFWEATCNRGVPQRGEFHRIGKGGQGRLVDCFLQQRSRIETASGREGHKTSA